MSETCTPGTATAACGTLTAKREIAGPMVDYEIVNMSDPYLMTCGDRRIAEVAVVVLGEGNYGLRAAATGETVLPPMPFGFGDKWMEREFGTADGFGEFLTNNGAAIADALDTVRLKKGRKRSSLNDIGARAKRMAEAMRGSK